MSRDEPTAQKYRLALSISAAVSKELAKLFPEQITQHERVKQEREDAWTALMVASWAVSSE